VASTRSRAINRFLPTLRRTLRLCQDALAAIQIRPGATLPDSLAKAFLAKATRTMKAIILLYERGLCEEAQSFVRILFELHVSFATFAHMMRADVTDACLRVLDSRMLDKMRQQRATDFKGLEMVPGAPSREDLERKEREIASRYEASERAAMRTYGFSGKNMEERCKLLDSHRGGTRFKGTYNVVYRNFSRNVHSTDITESLLHVDPTIVSARTRDLVENRDEVACDVVITSALDLVVAFNHEFKLGLEGRIARVRRPKVKRSAG
jgi:hypothetical protein